MNMKRFYVIISALCVMVSFAQAQEHVTVHYFLQAGGSVIVPGGDFDGTRVAHIIPDGDTNVVLEDVAVAKLPVFPLASFLLGVNIDASSLTAHFGYGRPMLQEFPVALAVAPQHGKWIDFGVEYQYHFLYPAVVRPALGVSYGFTRLNASDAAVAQTASGPVREDVLYYGTGPGMVAGVGWFGLEHMIASFEARGRYVSVSHLTTPENNFGIPDRTIRLWMMDVGVNVAYLF